MEFKYSGNSFEINVLTTGQISIKNHGAVILVDTKDNLLDTLVELVRHLEQIQEDE